MTHQQRNIERARILRKAPDRGWTAMRRHSLIWALARDVISLDDIREQHHSLKPSTLLAWAFENRALAAVDIIEGRGGRR